MTGERLTQSEVDSLISALFSGEIEDKSPPGREEYKPYDFRRPTKFTKEQLKTMHIVHENYCLLYTSLRSLAQGAFFGLCFYKNPGCDD